MTEQEQQIAIAEACGWHAENSGNKHSDLIFNPQGNSAKRWIDRGHVTPNWVDTWATCVHLPDYLHDLNAMYSAVTTQPYRFKLAFNQELHATASTLGCLVCELKAADWAACFLTVERDRRKLNA